MFPLKQKTLIRGCAAHIAAGLGCGADYVASTGTPLYAPSDGLITRQYTGTEGGKWLWFEDKDRNSLQFAHLSDYTGSLRIVKKGDLIAHTGNTGSITTGPHLHVQILNKDGVRLDPEKYNWLDNAPPPANTNPMGSQEQTNIEVFKNIYVANYGVEFGAIPTQVLADYVANASIPPYTFWQDHNSEAYKASIRKPLDDTITQQDARIKTLERQLLAVEPLRKNLREFIS